MTDPLPRPTLAIMAAKDRRIARELCEQHLRGGDALGWFEELYSTAAGDAAVIPWADLGPNPHFVRWHENSGFDFRGKRCLKIGCGLGDDCEYLAQAGGQVVGFDIAPSAIAWCRRRFPDSKVSYVVADVVAVPENWLRGFDFVLESYTLQVLPPDLRISAMSRVADCVAPVGRLLVICRGRGPADPAGSMPWPLLRDELGHFGAAGLAPLCFEDFFDDEQPPVRRFRALYGRP